MRVNHLVEATRNETQVILKETQEQAALHEQELVFTLHQIKEAHTREINCLNEIVSGMEKKHQTDISILNKRQDEIDQTNGIISNELLKQISLVTKEHQAAVQAIQDQIKTMNESHQQAVTSLNSQFSHTLNVQNEQLRDTQSSLKTAQEENKRNALELRECKKKLEVARKKQDQLQAMANDDSSGLGCIIS